ncbi:hypothetical protein [Megalodesulfovibrio paquesii]
MRAELEYRYGKKDSKGWNVSLFDLFPGEMTPFSIQHFKKDVQRKLLQKASVFSEYPNWRDDFLNAANSYSAMDAIIDFYYYGAKADKVVNDIEVKVKRLESGRR